MKYRVAKLRDASRGIQRVVFGNVFGDRNELTSKFSSNRTHAFRAQPKLTDHAAEWINEKFDSLAERLKRGPVLG